MLQEQLRLDENVVAFQAATHPRGERLLRGKVSGDDRAIFGREHEPGIERTDCKLGRKQRRILGTDAKHHQRASVADDGGPDPIRQLRSKLIGCGEKGGEFSCLAE